MKQQYFCQKCNEGFLLVQGSKYCPKCGSVITSKAEITAQNKITEMNAIMPKLKQKYNDFAILYAKYKILNETLRSYARRGIINREEIIDFNPETLTEIFHKNRKKRK